MKLNRDNLRIVTEGDTTKYFYSVEGYEYMVMDVKQDIHFYRIGQEIIGNKELLEIVAELKVSELHLDKETHYFEVTDSYFSQFLELYKMSAYSCDEEELDRFREAVKLGLETPQDTGIIEMNGLIDKEGMSISQKKLEFMDLVLDNGDFYKKCVMEMANKGEEQLDFAFKTVAMDFAYTLQKIVDYNGIYFPPQLKLSIIVKGNKDLVLALVKTGKIINV